MSDPVGTGVPEVPEGTVTVLFTDLVESTRLNQSLGDEGSRRVGRQVEEMARRIVAAHRGVLIKEMGDGLMAAFASARRAIAASREIQVEMGRFRRDGLDDAVAMRIGLHTGEVLSEDGDIHGETVIIAKRIEGLAPPGGILASETVHGVLGTARDELVEQGAAALKGIDAEWRLYLVPVPQHDDRVAPADNEPTPYVGRVAERERLRTAIEAAATGRGGMVLIGGPAGLGKSRLTREAAAMAERLGMNVLTGHCLDMESPPPYQPSIDHLEQAARAASPAGFRAALGENAPEVAKLLPSLRQRYEDIAPSPELTPEQERRYMLHGVAEFIERAAANQALVLVYEDLHWADESTLLLLRHLGARLPEVPVLVIGTYRDDELGPDRPLTRALGPLLRDVGAIDLRLRLLTVEEVEAVLTGRAGLPAPDELVDLVHAETQGNPFFVEELYRHLRDSGKLFEETEGRVDQLRWRSGFEIGETEVPHGVRLVIERRLERLDPEHRRILASAAVVGRSFPFELLATVAGAGDDALFDALEAAERIHLIEDVPGTDDARSVFVHEQIRQTLVGELSLARRQRLHVRIADALTARDDPPAVEIAHHLHQAGPASPAPRTVAALLAAAATAMAALAFEDALRHLDHVEPLIEGSARVDFASTRAQALRGAGRVDDALAVLDAELARTDDPADEVALRLQRVQLLNDQYRAAEGLDDVAALVAATPDPDLEIDVQLVRGRAHYILSLDDPAHADEARVAYEAAYAAARMRGDRTKMARALIPTTWFTDYWSDYQETAAANVAEALALAEELGDEDLILDATAASMHHGGVRIDVASSEALLARLEARRDPVKLNAHCFWLMWQYSAIGRFADAVDICDRGIALADLIGSKPVQYGSIKAIALVEMGRYDEVADAIAEEVTDDEHPFGQAMASLARSFFLARIAAWEPAARSLADTLDRAEALSRVWMQAWAGSVMRVVNAHLRVAEGGSGPPDSGGPARGLSGAEVALVEGRPDDAIEILDRLVPAVGADPERDHVIALDLLARARLALRDHVGAVEAADRGLALAVPMEFGSLEWRLRRVRALGLAGSGADGAAETEAEQEARRAAEQFAVLAGRIVESDREPELREWFLRQPLAPELPTGDDALA